MECEECHEFPASLHLTKLVNGQKSEIHVCERCAKEKGYIAYSEETYSIHDLLAGLFNFDSSFSKEHSHSPEIKQVLTCTKCGLTYQQFTQVGKFGCGNCYQTFADHLNPIFRRVHSGNTVHNGKIPKRRGSDLKQKRLVQDYKTQLQELIEMEEFEQAAELRDKIKVLENRDNNKLNDSKNGEV